MEVVTVEPIHGYLKHAARLTPQLQAWMDSTPGKYAPWLGYAHGMYIRTLCGKRPGSTKSVYTTPFESLTNEVTKTAWATKQNSVCTKCQRILKELNQKELND